ncbi:complex I NDUFA9 subunit family protein [Methylacidimicrobium tartarophylax]|uniref:3 beta-hydroxysteroid dehydrogenase/Delta 5-->4-isomerase n=1 Tax=Methylacidimicrobium tartarophylax TaxID=1041768 RepID=A0A5E6M657_9BACT|nr:complex I NDUFA9 subunit family protein [Methylacidimicrobium tartarophylax]VVM04820.1 3 beta-hydroxysteroid dehydrogenase/Delta 5-->4-isomerase [Methylacidimicrobium tartarophylax]
MATVLVTGGTGFVGSHLIPRLVELGYQVRLLTRRATRGRALPAERCTIIEGSPLDPDACRRASRETDAIIHLVGILTENPQSSYREAHVQVTRHLLAAAKENGVRRWIHMSALGARPYAASRYHQTKWTAEELVRSSDLHWTIFRPSVIYGKGDRFLSVLRNLFSQSFFRYFGMLPLPGGGASLLQPVAVRDVVTAFTRALILPETIGKEYPLCGPDRISLSEICFLLLQREHQVVCRTPSWPRLCSRLFLFAILFAFFPLSALVAFAGGFSPEDWSVLLAAWGSLSLLSLRSRPVLFVSIPWSVVLGLAPFAAKLPSNLPIGREQLLMLEEGNIADSSIAARDLGLEFLPFRDGLASLFPDGQVSLPLPESSAGQEDRGQLL